jgi:hypothetical protein
VPALSFERSAAGVAYPNNTLPRGNDSREKLLGRLGVRRVALGAEMSSSALTRTRRLVKAVRNEMALIAAILLIGCGDGGKKETDTGKVATSSQTQTLFQDARTLQSVSAVANYVDDCGRRATARRNTRARAACETPRGLARSAAASARIEGNDVLVVRLTTGGIVRVAFGSGPGEIAAATTPKGLRVVGHSVSGNVFTETRSFGRRDTRIVCVRAGAGICPKSGRIR